MRASGNRHVAVVEVPDRDHIGLMTGLTATDDRIGELVLGFVRSH